MKRLILTLLVALALTLAIPGAASATPTSPGPPTATNCVGQTTSFMAQKFADSGEPGLANTASEFSRTVKEEAEWIRDVRCSQ
jgi:hypothetical protein